MALSRLEFLRGPMRLGCFTIFSAISAIADTRSQTSLIKKEEGVRTSIILELVSIQCSTILYVIFVNIVFISSVTNSSVVCALYVSRQGLVVCACQVEGRTSFQLSSKNDV